MAMKTNPYSTLGEAMALGIDVSKARLALCWLLGEVEQHHEIDNQHAALERLAQALVCAGYRGKIVIESTGYYHWLAVVILSGHGLDVRLVNPLLAHKHHQAAIRKTKTDPVDAFQLATMCLTERRLPPSWDRDAQWVQHRHQVGLLRTVERTLQQLTAALNDHGNALAMMGAPNDPMVESLRQQTLALVRAKKHAEAQLAASLAALDEARQARYGSIPGVSRYLAGLMNLLLNPDVRQAKSWIAYVGLDISVRRSGTWVGRSKVTKRGFAYLRKRLYQAAWGAKQNDPHFRAYYDELRAQGRGYVETLLIIARKLLRIAFVLQQRGQMYDPTVAWA